MNSRYVFSLIQLWNTNSLELERKQFLTQEHFVRLWEELPTFIGTNSLRTNYDFGPNQGQSIQMKLNIKV